MEKTMCLPPMRPAHWAGGANHEAALTAKAVESPPKPRPRQPLGIAVIVTCHGDYLPWLPECLESIDAQEVPGERIVVFDGCDAPAWLAAKPHWQAMRGDWHHANPARNLGMTAVRSPWIVWFDADNQMPTGYLAAYREQTTKAAANVACIYPDIQYTDEHMQPTRRLRTGEFDYWRLREDNFIDTSACWRRTAVERVGGWPVVDGMDDWALAMALTRDGWTCQHSTGPSILMREHSFPRRSQNHTRTVEAGVRCRWPIRTMALVTLLAPNRDAAHQRWLSWLRSADLPPLTSLVLVDNRNTGDASLLHAAQTARPWQSVTHIADDARLPDTRWVTVHTHVARLYRRALATTNADLILTVEDDVEPPPNAVRLLYEAYARCWTTVGAIGGVYASPSHPDDWSCAALDPEQWRDVPRMSEWPNEPGRVQFLGGGCTLYAGWAVRKALPIETSHSANGSGLGWDATLCYRLRKAGYSIWMDGRVRCAHHLHGKLSTQYAVHSTQ